MSKHLSVAVAGATGIVGQEILSILEDSELPIGEVSLLASSKSEGEVYRFREQESVIQALDKFSFENVDLAFFATSAKLAEEFVPKATAAGALVIDNSRHFRMQADVPLVVPEVNISSVEASHKIIANPNCSTIQLVPLLKLLEERAGIKRVVVSTYQAVSGAGRAAIDELFEETRGIFSQKEYTREQFQHQIAFNCIPAIDTFLENGYTREEEKIIGESRKILGLPELRITATAVRVPVFHGHGESVNVELNSELNAKDAAELFESSGIAISKNPEHFPMQAIIAGQDPIAVGRLRVDHSVDHGLNFWVVADNIRKGAALNAVQIAEALLERSPSFLGMDASAA